MKKIFHKYFSNTAIKLYMLLLSRLLITNIKIIRKIICYKQNREIKRREKKRPDDRIRWFISNEAELLTSIASFILPSDKESPGAIDLDIVFSLERILAKDPYRKKIYANGLYSIDRWSILKNKMQFLNLDDNKKLEVLKLIDSIGRDINKKNSIKNKILSKIKILPSFHRGLSSAIEFFPCLVHDIFKIFYTSEIAWVWLNYDGPPMLDGYEDLSNSRRPVDNDNQIEKKNISKHNLDKKMLICLKNVPARDSGIILDDKGNINNIFDIDYETNEIDLYALEIAKKIKKESGGEITVLSVGNETIKKGLRNALAKGADQAIHIFDKDNICNDPIRTACIIAKIISGEGFDIVFTGVESWDSSFGQTGVIISEILKWPSIIAAIKVKVNESWSKANVERELENSLSEDLDIILPAVITVQSNSEELKPISLKDIIKARKKLLRRIDIKKLFNDSQGFQSYKSNVEYLGLVKPKKNKKTIYLNGSSDSIAENLLKYIRNTINIS